MDLPKSILELKGLQALILDGNPLIKQFEPLLDKKASFDIQKSLRQVFGLEMGSEKETKVDFVFKYRRLLGLSNRVVESRKS